MDTIPQMLRFPCFSILISSLCSSFGVSSDAHLAPVRRRRISLATRFRNERRLRVHRCGLRFRGDQQESTDLIYDAVRSESVADVIELRVGNADFTPEEVRADCEVCSAAAAAVWSEVPLPCCTDDAFLPDPTLKSGDEAATVPRTVLKMLEYVYHSVISDISPFGEYCRVWLNATPLESCAGRSRDIFPLPLMRQAVLPSPCEYDAKLLCDFSNLVILSLNFLWDDFSIGRGKLHVGPCNAAQRTVHEHILTSVLRMLERLGDLAAAPRPDTSSTTHPPLKASLVETGSQACTCNSQTYLSQPLRATILQDRGLFRDVGAHRNSVPRFTGIDRSQYALVTWSGLDIGKLRLRTNVQAGGTVFAVPKPSGAQREVWHGRYVSSLAPTPPKPSHQPTPACLLDLEVSKENPMYFSKRDAVSYFDCLAAPAYMREWFGRPALRIGELLDAVDGLTLEALAEYVDGPLRSPLDPTTRVYPTACCWPMGFSWSSAVGQDVMLYQVRAAGMTDANLLADDKPAPDFGKIEECHAVCTDDVMHWARTVLVAKRRLDKLDTQWLASGITRRPNKDIDWCLKGTALGCDFDGEN